MKNLSVVLLSAGLDSAANAWMALRNKDSVALAITIDYGQRAAAAEIRQAQLMAKTWNISHEVLKLDFVKSWGGSALTDESQDLPTGRDIEVDSLAKSQDSAKAVWVPNRNGLFINVAAGFAEKLSAKRVLVGFNKEEAATFPDNSADFMNSVSQSLSFSTRNQVEAFSYTVEMNKTEIVRELKKTGFDFSLIWPCYQNKEKWCGVCESCQRSLRALRNEGVAYENFVA